ncbi:MAG: 50S ribosomal protein L29 [Candidatus Pacebacteria bacterium]|jgi:ribosomal protein L29|nr:50S ribosomal protein L29 [Candidatus Paceibacterota bacterium]|tara:strand:+ start:7613 stop:7810 length:198 start_codon:yes stop_codon:yes gene_type:complete
MEMKNLIKKKDSDLAKLLKEKREGFKSFRFSITGTKTRNVKAGKALKKDIAQILTEINKRRLHGK